MIFKSKNLCMSQTWNVSTSNSLLVVIPPYESQIFRSGDGSDLQLCAQKPEPQEVLQPCLGDLRRDLADTA